MRSRRAAGLLLLALTVHAFVASATHFHSLTSPGAQPAQSSFQSNEQRGQNAPLSGDEKQCLLCRLQQNFVSEVQHAIIVLAPRPTWTPGYAVLKDVSPRASCTLLRPGRAPPSIQA